MQIQGSWARNGIAIDIQEFLKEFLYIAIPIKHDNPRRKYAFYQVLFSL